MVLSGNREWAWRCLPILAAALVCAPLGASDEFEKQVRPLLAAKCHICHGEKQQMGGLNLSTREGFLAGGGRGPLINAEQPAESLLLRVVHYGDGLKMPPMGKLQPAEIAALEQWVAGGAEWPAEKAARQDAPHWAFQPLRKDLPSSSIDHWLNERMAAEGVVAAGPADKLTLLRRATFDLTGLPPTPDEIEAFEADERPDAFERVIDRLLASPAYGERWGRHWLDVARYADSTGADEDHRYPHAWRYRDYVIRAFNSDKPYDRFVREQIAGDLLPPEDPAEGVNVEGIVATGFLALGPKLIAEIDKLKMFYDSVDEQIEVTSKAFLGLTLACARCHDHKFDPLSTKDYYAMASIFASTKNWGKVEGSPVVSTLYDRPLVPIAEEKAYEDALAAIEAKKGEVNAVLGKAGKRYRDARMERLAESMQAAYRIYEEGADAAETAAALGLEPEVLDRWVSYLKPTWERRPQLEAWYAAKTPEARASAAAEYQQRFLATAAERDEANAKWEAEAAAAKERGEEPPAKPKFFAGDDRFFSEVSGGKGPYALPTENRDEHLTAEAKQQLETLQAEQKQLEETAPKPPLANAVNEGKPVEQHVFLRGDPRQEGDLVPKRFPVVLAGERQTAIQDGSGRLELANWLASPDNPMTARVMVNRIWLGHFGEGIVRTPNNFGRIGEPPTHPELLDALAAELIASGWSVKSMHRRIMLSGAYRRSSVATAEQVEKDPENRLLARFPSRRLTVEEMRDGLLSLDGSLDRTLFGALSSGEGTDKEFSDARKSLHPDDTKRRTIYVSLRRSNLPTLFSLFDFGDAVTSNPQRSSTNVAPQALYMLNSDFIAERAGALATMLLADPSLDENARLRRAHLLVLNRPADAAWLDLASSYLAGYPDAPAEQAWTSLCRTLIASNDFLYIQ
ncbi:MAG: DUF1549 domain-containing protein [Acidobacteria bacterium]|nr:DUF1549 domain-containing protein [Acidobacteriota bacterium]